MLFLLPQPFCSICVDKFDDEAADDEGGCGVVVVVHVVVAVGEEAPAVTPPRLRADVEAAEVRSSWPSVVGIAATKRPLLRERSRIDEEDEAM